MLDFVFLGTTWRDNGGSLCHMTFSHSPLLLPTEWLQCNEANKLEIAVCVILNGIFMQTAHCKNHQTIKPEIRNCSKLDTWHPTHYFRRLNLHKLCVFLCFAEEWCWVWSCGGTGWWWRPLDVPQQAPAPAQHYTHHPPAPGQPASGGTYTQYTL